MVKKSLYCVPYNGAVKRNRNGMVYQCEIENEEGNGEAARPATVGSVRCKVCNLSFKDERCLKIHKTKKGHWGNSINDPDEGPKRPTNKHKDMGANVPNRKRRTKPNQYPAQAKRAHHA
jgi:hypothetical protein